MAHHYNKPISAASKSKILEQGILAPASRWPKPTVDEPSEDEIESWVFDSVCEATDGCAIEPDGVCEHGYPSWLMQLGII